MPAVLPPQPNTDMIALQAQCDISRLFDLVGFPALERLATSTALTECVEAFPAAPEVETTFGFGQFDLSPPTVAAAMLTEVRDTLVQETRRGLALILGATFERQIRSWLSNKEQGAKSAIADENWRDLTDRIKRVVGVDLRSIDGLTVDLYELWELVSATRHGDGKAATNLAKIAPHLWPSTALLEAASSENLRVEESDLRRYYYAVLVCWGELGATPSPHLRPIKSRGK